MTDEAKGVWVERPDGREDHYPWGSRVDYAFVRGGQLQVSGQESDEKRKETATRVLAVYAAGSWTRVRREPSYVTSRRRWDDFGALNDLLK